MPVRKKNKSHAHRLKMETAQHQKQFINEVRDIIEKTAGSDVLRYIPQYELEHLYKVRCHPVRVKAASGMSISSGIIQFSNFMVTRLFKNTYIPIGLGTLTHLSLYSFFSTGLTVMVYSLGLKEDAYPHADEVKKVLAPLAALIDSPVQDEALDKYYDIMFLIAVFCCDINEYLYTIEFHPENIAKGILKSGVYSEIYKTQLPKVKVLVEERLRPAWHVGWCFANFEPPMTLVSVKSEDIYQPPGNMLDVYIQSHAINRLAERLEGIDVGVLHFNIFNSLNQPKICRNKKGVLLFEYAIFKNKAGYFLGEVADGKVILKTFLFLTNMGTPEADRLQANTGLMKEDIIYLAIDKLSAFMHSDIAGNERIKQLFINSGCESLFKINKGHFVSSKGNEIGSKAESIEKYLQLDTLPKRRKI